MSWPVALLEYMNEDALGCLGAGGPLAIDVEATTNKWHEAELKCLSFGTAHEAYVVPVDSEAFREVYGRLLNRDTLLAHNWKYDWHVMGGVGAPLHKKSALCTLTLYRLNHPEAYSAALEDAAPDIAVSGMNKRLKELKMTWANADWRHPELVEYAGRDVLAAYQIYNDQISIVNKAVLSREMTSQRVVYDMETKGIGVDSDYATDIINKLSRIMVEVRARSIDEYDCIIAGKGSVKSIAATLESLNVPLLYTNTGKVSTAAGALRHISDHPLVAMLQAHKRLTKINGTWLKPFAAATDGRVYPSIHCIRATTGRMAVTDPPMQTLPRLALVRRCVVPAEGHVLAAVDYSQQELRIVAMVTGDENLINVCNSEDPHTENARSIFQREPTVQERYVIKQAFFSLIYGAGDDLLTTDFGIPMDLVKMLRASAVRSYPNVMRLLPSTERLATYAGGYATIENPFGRTLRTPSKISHTLGNHMVQSIGADVLKDAIIRLDDAGLSEYAILPMHDEQLFELPIDEADELLVQIVDTMTDNRFRAPLLAEGELLTNWGQKYLGNPNIGRYKATERLLDRVRGLRM